MPSAGVPYSYAKRFTVEAGVNNFLEIPAPIRGTLTRLVIIEAGGTSDFTADLYTADRPAGGPDVSDTDVQDDNVLLPQAFKFKDTITATGGLYEAYNLDRPYVVNEKKHQGMLKSALYIRLTPSGSGTKRYDIAITVVTPVFS